MFDRPPIAEERERQERPSGPVLFGPPTAAELMPLEWDWRREVAKGMLLVVEGLPFLAWILFIIRLSRPDFDRGGVLVVGWILLALLALAAAHAVIRTEERIGWGRVRIWLILVMTVTTMSWWGVVSGSLATFLREIGAAFRLQAGPGFWTLWLGILAWSRGFEWSARMLGAIQARNTLFTGLGLLAALTLIAPLSGSPMPLLSLVTLTWLLGLVALGLARLVLEDWRLSTVRPARFAGKQAAIVATSSAVTIAAGSVVLWVMQPARRAWISEWLLAATEEPRRWLLLLALRIAILFVTVVWLIVFRAASLITDLFGLEFDAVPPPPEPPPADGSLIDALFVWLEQLLTPRVSLAIGSGVLLLFLGVVLFYLLSKLDRLTYFRSLRPGGEDEEREPGRLRLALDRLPRPPRLWPRRRPPEPEDTVRRIYVRLVRMGERRGVPWRAPATPYEHESHLHRALPELNEEIRLITEQYVRVRYAGERPQPADLDALQAAWRRVRRAAE